MNNGTQYIKRKVDLIDCVPLTKEHEEAAMCEVYDGYAWILDNIRPVKPIHVKGQLSIFNLPDHLVKHIKILV